jgi:F-type H+-transporting ATPase subunit b
MADSAYSTETTQAHTGHGQDAHGEINPMEISGQMVIWTWILFFITLGALYKLAWKPILSALDKREEEIQESMDNAERIREELESIEEKRASIIGAADEKSKAVLEAARTGAKEQARVIEAKAREEAEIMAENARREIDDSRAKAEDELRIESAAWARELAGRLIEANLDDEKNRALTDKLIEEL